MTRPNSTLIVYVLDKSGSMAGCLDATIEGFNGFLKSQKEDQKVVGDDVKVTLAQFDTFYELKYNAIPLENAYELNRDNYRPGGGTALFDAVGRTMTEVGTKLALMAEHERPSKVLFVILTDGDENSSREYDRSRILSMVEHQKTKYSWEFVFIGANIDAAKVGGAMGFANTMNYSADLINTRAVYASMDSFTKGYRSTGKINKDDLSDKFD